MATFRELVYLVLDEIKGISNDFTYTEDHIIFILSKYRTFILKQRYGDIKKPIPESNYQTIHLDLDPIEIPSTINNIYLRSTSKMPVPMKIGYPRVFENHYYNGELTYISKDRMKYIGYNKYLKNIIYCSLGPDFKLYLKSSNPIINDIQKVEINAIFQDIVHAFKLYCDDVEGTTCDILDSRFPLEDSLIPIVVELTVKELLGASYRPADLVNNDQDDMSNPKNYNNNNKNK